MLTGNQKLRTENDMEPLKIMINDTWGTDVHPRLRDRHPNITYTPNPLQGFKGSGNPHGHMCAECISWMIPPDQEVELIMTPWLGHPAGIKAEGFITIPKDHGVQIVNNSWGIPVTHDSLIDRMLASQYQDPKFLEYARIHTAGMKFFWASGNFDRSTDTRANLSNDVSYPQKALAKLPGQWLVAACDVGGTPSNFSSDGSQVSTTYFGEGVRVMDPDTGNDTFVNGTSFASPFACGDYAAESLSRGHLLDDDAYHYYITNKSTIARGWDRGSHHPKVGYGPMLQQMRDRLIKHGNSLLALTESNFTPSMLDLQVIK